ncbi:MAG: hypothetical protein CL943_03505 [Candidatus Diapherotrites archaeon]|uniref:Uncharacterized protein n=1 Tax=Candidatus Iainarchaeum sp. TaxID=3101447 RepID=A0A2D6M1P8_9ARCH|nr:hypothetical protein [Candidatus Diapherotrites archaeon]
MMRTKKGFLGPIGDDLPSLIPLVFALTIFFYIFTFTWNTFDEKNRSFDNDISILRVSSILKGNSYIPNYSTFVERCNEANSVKRISFKAGLLPLYVRRDNSFEGIDIEELDFFSDPETGDTYVCSNTDEEPVLGTHEILVRFFPVALERDYRDEDGRHFFVKPMLLVVIAWQ